MGRYAEVGAKACAGFTLVELTMVIVLIGALSALGIGLFARSSTFSPLLATQQLESAALLAQQAALAGSTSENRFSVSSESDDFLFTVGSGDAFRIPRGDTTLTTDAVFPVTFDPMGRPDTGSEVQFTFTGESTYRICMSSLGAVYRGSC